jgi:hypothetical protein
VEAICQLPQKMPKRQLDAFFNPRVLPSENRMHLTLPPRPDNVARRSTH